MSLLSFVSQFCTCGAANRGRRLMFHRRGTSERSIGWIGEYANEEAEARGNSAGYKNARDITVVVKESQ
jgi:hypothetical protein